MSDDVERPEMAEEVAKGDGAGGEGPMDDGAVGATAHHGGADGGAPPPAQGGSSDETVSLDQVRMALRRVKDPDLNLNIVDLGLIYDVAVEGAAVKIDMSLTSPGCPSGPEIMTGAETAVRGVPGVHDVTVNLVWSPMWTPERIEPRVRSYLGF